MECNYKNKKTYAWYCQQLEVQILKDFWKTYSNQNFHFTPVDQYSHSSSDLSVKQIDEIQKIWNEFECEGSPVVVDQKTIYTPVKENGLGLHRVANFWGAVKLSWLRRLPYTKSLWKSIHREEVGYTMFDPISYYLDHLTTAKKELKTLFVREFTKT